MWRTSDWAYKCSTAQTLKPSPSWANHLISKRRCSSLPPNRAQPSRPYPSSSTSTIWRLRLWLSQPVIILSPSPIQAVSWLSWQRTMVSGEPSSTIRILAAAIQPFPTLGWLRLQWLAWTWTSCSTGPSRRPAAVTIVCPVARIRRHSWGRQSLNWPKLVETN